MLSLLVTDEDVYYKNKIGNNVISTSTLQDQFAQLDIVAEILPHFTLVDPNDKYLPLHFVNNTYSKNMTVTENGTWKMMKFAELYYKTDNTTDDLPYLNFNLDYVPVGDSRSTCLHIRQMSKTLPKTRYENYTSVQKMGECFGANKTTWGSSDPKTGINFIIWKEFGTANKTDCKEGVIKNNICYEYSILKKLCIIIYPVDDTFQQWFFQNG